MNIGKWLKGAVLAIGLSAVPTNTAIIETGGVIQSVPFSIALHLNRIRSPEIPYSAEIIKEKLESAIQNSGIFDKGILKDKSTLQPYVEGTLDSIKKGKKDILTKQELIILTLAYTSELFPEKEKELKELLEKYRESFRAIINKEIYIGEEKGIFTNRVKNIAEKYTREGKSYDYEFEIVFLFVRATLDDYTLYKGVQTKLSDYDKGNNTDTKKTLFELLSILIEHPKELKKVFENHKLRGKNQKSFEQFQKDIKFYALKFREIYYIPQFKDYIKSQKGDILQRIETDKKDIDSMLKASLGFQDETQTKQDSNSLLNFGKELFDKDNKNLFATIIRKIAFSYEDIEIIDNRTGEKKTGKNSSKVIFEISRGGEVTINFNLRNVNQERLNVLIRESNKAGVSPFISIAKAIIESNMCKKEDEISSSFAQGCMQVKEISYNEIEKKFPQLNLPEFSISNNDEKLIAGVYYIKYLMKRYKINPDSLTISDMVILAIGYNAGPDVVLNTIIKITRGKEFKVNNETIKYYQHLVILLRMVKLLY